MELLRTSADKGNKNAQLQLAFIYFYEEELRDIEKAKFYSKMCSENGGDDECLFLLSNILIEERNFEEASKYLKLLEKKGRKEATEELKKIILS